MSKWKCEKCGASCFVESDRFGISIGEPRACVRGKHDPARWVPDPPAPVEATATPAPVDPGEGYGLLEEGEIVRDTDEFLNHSTGKWESTKDTSGVGDTWTGNFYCPMRRRIEVKPASDKPFWLVWNPSHGEPTHRHATPELARAEALRLAGLERKTIYVLQSIGEVTAPAVKPGESPVPCPWHSVSETTPDGTYVVMTNYGDTFVLKCTGGIWEMAHRHNSGEKISYWIGVPNG